MKLEAVKRVLTGLTGPISFAAANFAISLLLQQSSTAHEFGLYAFGQIVIGALLGFSNGLFSSPLIVSLAENSERKTEVFSSFFVANSIFTFLCVFISALLFYIAKADFFSCILFSFSTAIMIFRWFGRSCDLASNSRKSAALSDIFYGILGTILSILLYFGGTLNLPTALAIQISAATLSIIPSAKSLLLGIEGLKHNKSFLQIYRKSFSLHGKWAVSAVAATQVTANFHSYLVTFTLGASQFAPLALATLLYRPIGVILTGLVQFERPRLAAKIQKKSMAELGSDVRFVAIMVLLTWILNTLTIFVSFIVFPSALDRDGYSTSSVTLAVVLTAAVVLVRALREPKTAALQAGGEFKGLARVTALCAPITVAAVAVVLVVAPEMAALSLLGALFGEILNLLLTNKIYRRFIRKLADNQ